MCGLAWITLPRASEVTVAHQSLRSISFLSARNTREHGLQEVRRGDGVLLFRRQILSPARHSRETSVRAVRIQISCQNGESFFSLGWTCGPITFIVDQQRQQRQRREEQRTAIDAHFTEHRLQRVTVSARSIARCTARIREVSSVVKLSSVFLSLRQPFSVFCRAFC